MQKIKNFLLSINYPVLVFFTVGMRITVFGASIGDAIVILSLCAYKGLVKWIENQKNESLTDEVKKELNDIKAHVSSLVIKNSIKTTVAPDNQIKKFF